jgi:hypothetical protein
MKVSDKMKRESTIGRSYLMKRPLLHVIAEKVEYVGTGVVIHELD